MIVSMSACLSCLFLHIFLQEWNVEGPPPCANPTKNNKIKKTARSFSNQTWHPFRANTRDHMQLRFLPTLILEHWLSFGYDGWDNAGRCRFGGWVRVFARTGPRGPTDCVFWIRTRRQGRYDPCEPPGRATYKRWRGCKSPPFWHEPSVQRPVRWFRLHRCGLLPLRLGTRCGGSPGGRWQKRGNDPPVACQRIVRLFFQKER
mmetsp:Transcript_37347/g.57325  ORF Transcript_37347/g.57325 Transcript_37347/m.57325 type:complete len:203 (-) Transcript_37347:335-943(-)